MSKTKWLSGAHVVDLSIRPYSRGNGPFVSNGLYGVCLHVNVAKSGTPDNFWKNNPDQVTPNFQVFKSSAAGGVHQMLPFNWQPWCQVEGNYHYAAIETAGYPDEELTDYQMEAIAKIMAVYHTDYGVPLYQANVPGHRGLIVHSAGGAAWGGHSCPGPIRAGERVEILQRARKLLSIAAPADAGHDPIDPSPRPRLRRAWPDWMPDGHYFGALSGPYASHGGYDAREREEVAAIQRRFQALGFAPKDAWWADGVWEAATTTACRAWHKKYFPSAGHFDIITYTAWKILFKS